MSSISIAKSLDGKILSATDLAYEYDSHTGIYTFSDNSQARILTRFENCEPYDGATLSTMSKKRVRYWKAL